MQRDSDDGVNVIRPACDASRRGGLLQLSGKEDGKLLVDPRTTREFGLSDSAAEEAIMAVITETGGMLEVKAAEKSVLDFVIWQFGMHTRQHGKTTQADALLLRQHDAAAARTTMGEDEVYHVVQV